MGRNPPNAPCDVNTGPSAGGVVTVGRRVRFRSISGKIGQITASACMGAQLRAEIGLSLDGLILGLAMDSCTQHGEEFDRVIAWEDVPADAVKPGRVKLIPILDSHRWPQRPSVPRGTGG